VRHFLGAAGEREALAKSMRGVALEHMTYAGVTRRMLNFIAGDLLHRTQPNALAA
jgi:hypothetical protein